MSNIPAYQHFDGAGWYTHATPADPHPIREGAWMPPPYGATDEPLPEVIAPGHRARWVDGTWVTQLWMEPQPPAPTIDQLRAARLLAVTAACEQEIVSGFASAALGALHSYPSKLTDQVNLQASVIDSIVPGLAVDWTTPFWCVDAGGVWGYRPHTAAQIQQVGRDGKAAILACLERKGLLEAQIAAATAGELEAIVW